MEPINPLKPNITKLGQWLHSWIQPDGAIHGFNNHSVWGGNPYRWNDFFSGHSTWSSPVISGLALALRSQFSLEGKQLLESMIRFQCREIQPSGQYKYIGYETGDLSKSALIHNAMPNAALGLAALYGKEYLSAECLELIRTAVLNNMDVLRSFSGGRAGAGGTCNQEYARVWGKLLFQLAYEDDRWRDEIPEDLDFLIRYFHVSGLPDDESEGTLRHLNEPDAVEPAEYYGLMIAPLMLAYEVYGKAEYLDHAAAICNHLVRSSWTDNKAQSRFHRLSFRHNGIWQINRQPMLISGMGHSLYGIARCLEHRENPEWQAFIEQCSRTYAHYQHPNGFFAPATGWMGEADVVPATAWHAHDFHYLLYQYGVEPNFWDELFTPLAGTSVLLGDQCYWVEQGAHWAVCDYFWQDVYGLRGLKNQTAFGRDIPDWIETERRLPAGFRFEFPIFLKTEAGIVLKSNPNPDKKLFVSNNSQIPYVGG